MQKYEGLGQYIEAKAKEAGYRSIKALSTELGFAPSYLSGIIRGRFNMSPERCQELAEFFRDDATITLELAGYIEPVNDRWEKLVRQVEQLPPDLQENLFFYLKCLQREHLTRR